MNVVLSNSPSNNPAAETVNLLDELLKNKSFRVHNKPYRKESSDKVLELLRSLEDHQRKKDPAQKRSSPSSKKRKNALDPQLQLVLTALLELQERHDQQVEALRLQYDKSVEHGMRRQREITVLEQFSQRDQQELQVLRGAQQQAVQTALDAGRTASYVAQQELKHVGELRQRFKRHIQTVSNDVKRLSVVTAETTPHVQLLQEQLQQQSQHIQALTSQVETLQVENQQLHQQLNQAKQEQQALLAKQQKQLTTEPSNNNKDCCQNLQKALNQAQDQLKQQTKHHKNEQRRLEQEREEFLAKHFDQMEKVLQFSQKRVEEKDKLVLSLQLQLKAATRRMREETKETKEPLEQQVAQIYTRVVTQLQRDRNQVGALFQGKGGSLEGEIYCAEQEPDDISDLESLAGCKTSDDLLLIGTDPYNGLMAEAAPFLKLTHPRYTT